MHRWLSSAAQNGTMLHRAAPCFCACLPLQEVIQHEFQKQLFKKQPEDR